jgi:hypothetical protein
MERKVWHKVQIATGEQNISVYPTEEYDGIIVETTEFDGSNSRTYLHQDEMELLIAKMREMMAYVKS